MITIKAASRLKAFSSDMNYETRLQQLSEAIDEPEWGVVVKASSRLRAENWSADVETKHSTPEGTFKGTSDSIARELKKEHGDDFKGAMSALNFYINRGGDDLPNKDAVEGAKDKLRKLYGKDKD